MNAPSSLGRSIVVERNEKGLQAPGEALRPIVVVLGMHRSGTSLCAHILSMLGVDMADEAGPGRGNDKGHWERLEIMAFQDEILAAFDRAYWTPQHDFPLPPGWWADPKARAVQARIESFLTARMPAKALFGFKDPRTARLLPLWLQVFKNLNLAPRFILCLRAPSQIARSLQQRDGLDPAIGEYRALNYLADCFRYIPRHDLCIVDYETWFDNYSDNLHGLMDFLNIEWNLSETDLAAAVAEIVDRDLRHSEPRLGAARQPLVRSFYNLAAGLRAEPARRGEIDHFVNQFVAFQQLLAPFERAQRELVAIAARAPGLEARIAELETASQASQAAGAQGEQAAREALAARTDERDAARAGEAGVAERLAQSEARIAALEEALRAAGEERERARTESEATLHAESAAARQREQALGEELAQRGREMRSLDAAFVELGRQEQVLRAAANATTKDLETAAENLSTVKRREQQADEANARLSSELAAARTDLLAAQERLTEKEARFADLAAVLQASEAAARKREHALRETLAARDGEARQREQALRTANENAQRNFEAQMRALRDQFIDADAALAKSKVRSARPLLSGGSRGLERKLMRSGLFDAEWYKSEYKDAAQSGLSPARHYLEKGYLNGYRPNPLFDTRWYLDRYEDVRRSGMNPLLHYMEYGAREGRDPGPGFQTEFYLEANPDVRDNGVNPLAHYLRHGRHERRMAVEPVEP